MRVFVCTPSTDPDNPIYTDSLSGISSAMEAIFNDDETVQGTEFTGFTVTVEAIDMDEEVFESLDEWEAND